MALSYEKRPRYRSVRYGIHFPLLPGICTVCGEAGAGASPGDAGLKPGEEGPEAIARPGPKPGLVGAEPEVVGPKPGLVGAVELVALPEELAR